jgi:hypothetical protein
MKAYSIWKTETNGIIEPVQKSFKNKKDATRWCKAANDRSGFSGWGTVFSVYESKTRK